mgnify:CR=1 FL=1
MRALPCLALVALVACRGEVIVVQAIPSNDMRDYFACHLVRWQVRSIRVQVIEYHGVENTESLSQECVDVPAGTPIGDQWSMLEWFDERGYIVRGVPASISTRVQLVGFDAPGCPSPNNATVCAVSGESLSNTTWSGGEAIPFLFVCRCDPGCGPFEGDTLLRWRTNGQAFDACLFFEDLDEFGD